MAKLKLNLPTGATVEKHVVTCFNVDNKSYLILDAENIGSMGLPIILVSKIEDNKVVKITDSTEWQQAKDYLKGIIAGNTMNYVSVASEMSADEVYYTQLTLPVASFDVIKNNYKVEEVSVPLAEESVPVVEPTPTIDVAPVVEPVIPDVPTVEPAVPTIESEVSDSVPVVDLGVTPVIPEVPVMSVPENTPTPVVEENVVPATPVLDPVISEAATEGIDFAESKEAFMKACENMFDALVSKFQAELDSKK